MNDKKYELTDETITTESGVKLYRIKALRDFGDVNAGDLGGFIEKESNLSHEGNCWISGKAQVSGYSVVGDDACVLSGVINGGEIYGGEIYDGKIYGGKIYGGEIYDGKIYGGKIYGGAIRGGKIYGGAIRGGKIYGGVIYGGVIRGGEIYGGEINGGEINGGEIYGGEIIGGVIKGSADISSRHHIFTASHVGRGNGTLTVYKGKYGLLATRGCFFGTVEEFLAKSKEVHDEKTRSEYERLIEVAKSLILG